MTTDIIELKIKFAEKHKIDTGDKVPKNADPEEVRILRQAGYLVPNGDTEDLIFWRYK